MLDIFLEKWFKICIFFLILIDLCIPVNDLLLYGVY